MKDKKILYVNACIREESRTDKLAKALLEQLGQYDEINLEEAHIEPLNRERLNHRENLLSKGEYNDESLMLAKQFASADVIVIAAPYWDTSFPAVVKVYLENIYVVGIVSEYDEGGNVHGLCKAEKLYYVTTAGGPYEPEFGYGYIRKLALSRFGIKDTELVFAENLDIVGNNPDEILQAAIDELNKSER